MAKTKKRKNKLNADQVRMNGIIKQNQAGVEAVRKNKFEIKMNKQKFSILNRKQKNHLGLPGVSRSAAIKKREKTLLVEMKGRNNTSTIRDKRIGAGDASISVEDKMLQRMTIERKRKHNKRDMFNLTDDVELTHGGKPLSMGGFEDDDAFSDDEFDDQRQQMIEDTGDNFGGGVFSKKKTEEAKDKLEEIIIQSKIDKAERKARGQKQKDLFELLETKHKAESVRLNQAFGVTGDQLKELIAAKNGGKKADNLFKTVQRRLEMSVSRRVMPSARLKSPEELKVEAEKKAKEQAEDRLRRMRGETKSQQRKQQKANQYLQSSDALCDDFVLEVPADENEVLSFPFQEGSGDKEEKSNSDEHDPELDGNLVLSDIEDDEENEEEEEEDLSGSGGDLGISVDADYNQSPLAVVEAGDNGDDDRSCCSSALSDDDDDDDSFADIDSGNEDLSEETNNGSDDKHFGYSLHGDHDVIRSTSSKSGADKKLKFPESYSEFADLVQGASVPTDKPTPQPPAVTVINNLRTKFAPHLGKGNKEKLSELFAHVWQHCLKQPDDEMSQGEEFNMKQLDPFISHLYDLCKLNPQACSERVVEMLKRSYDVCFPTADVNDHKTYSPPWITLNHLLQLKMVKQIFPTSDKQHQVTTPALIFISRMLQQCKLASIRDMASGLYVATICYEFVSFSKRLVPECLNFLACALASRLPIEAHQKPEVRQAVLTRGGVTKKTCTLLQGQVETDDEVAPPNLVQVLNMNNDDDNAEQTRRSLFMLGLKLVGKFVELYARSTSFQHLFRPHLTILTNMKQQVDMRVQQTIDKLIADITATSQANCKRKKLSFGKARPAMLQMIVPKFEEDVGDMFSKRSKKQSAAKKMTERLLRQRKKEQKGAVRQIKKDAKFMAEHQQKKQEKLDEERRAAVKRLMGFVSDQVGEGRSIKRQKYKLDI